MRILYAVQATGNGHLSRARELTPYFQERAEVEIFISGTQSDVPFPYDIHHKRQGASFVFGQQGGVDLLESARQLSPVRLIRDIKNCPIDDYDFVINDFEPITAWACKLRGKRCVNLSHQAAFLSQHTPRPGRKNIGAESILKYFAPSRESIGFHFESYDDFIFTPIVRSQIRQASVSNEGHIAVYLPSYDDQVLAEAFKHFPKTTFKLFSKRAKQQHRIANVEINPIGNQTWIDALASSNGVIIGAGFEGPSEALFLGKKILAVPMVNQYEQRCNAAALANLGVCTIDRIRHDFVDQLASWLDHGEVIQMDYPDQTREIVSHIFAA